MPIRQSRGSTARLSRKLAAIGNDDGRTSLSEAVGHAVLDQVQQEFAAGIDPYGAPWEPIVSGKGQPLEGKRKLQRTFNVILDAHGVRLQTPLGLIVRAHNEGATLPARQVAGGE